MLLRRMVYNFMNSTQIRKINDVPISQMYPAEYGSIDGFMENNVIQDKVDTITPIPAIVPIVLRINLNIVELNLKNDDVIHIVHKE